MKEQEYAEITAGRIEEIIKTLREHGVLVSGNNPWKIVTNEHGVHLTAAWSEQERVLTVAVTDKNWYVSDGAVWSRLDQLMLRGGGA